MGTHTGYSIDKRERSSDALAKEYVPDSASQTSIRGLLTWIYITGTYPSGYPVRTATKKPNNKVLPEAQHEGLDVKIGIVIVG